MSARFHRIQTLLGAPWEKLARAHICVVGIGGVGSAAAEALARSGVGELTLIDSDEVAESNINRQLHASICTVGQPKVEAMAERLRLINPELKLHLYYARFAPEQIGGMDYVLDAIDDVRAKVALALVCREKNIPLIASMGTGNRMDPSLLQVGDLFETSGDPLARVMRHDMRKAGIEKLCVVFSRETPYRTLLQEDGGKRVPASAVFVPNAAGLLMASYAVRRICEQEDVP